MATIPLYPESTFFAAKAGAYRQGRGLFGMSQAETLKPTAMPAPTTPATMIKMVGEYGNLLDGLPVDTRPLVEAWVRKHAPTVLQKINESMAKMPIMGRHGRVFAIVETIRTGKPFIMGGYTGYDPAGS